MGGRWRWVGVIVAAVLLAAAVVWLAGSGHDADAPEHSEQYTRIPTKYQ